MLDLNDVALFVHVVRGGSFAAAARQLGMPSNTVSRHIQALEQQLGVRLLQRSTRRLTLTDAGSNFYARSADQIQALADAAQEVGEAGQRASGKVRVAAPADFFRWFPVAWMGDFLAAHPKVRLEFVLGDDKADLIAQGIDVAIRAGMELEPTLVARQIGTFHSTLVASPDYLAGRGLPASVAALASHDCIVLPRASGTAVWQLTGPEGVQEVEVTGRFHANTIQVLLDATLAGLGISLLPSLITAPYVRDGELVELLPGHGTDGLGIHIVYLSRRQLPRAVTAFVEFTMKKMLDEGLVLPAPAPPAPGIHSASEASSR
ncbi:LysR family transcriptional regulator [Dyella sp. Tek66A03]|uniref:LysR family transcriptional regulator n=1 Tax=Dyella sp. Tek66A03 TaxID=3458298 RepID=UPI00403E9E92